MQNSNNPTLITTRTNSSGNVLNGPTNGIYDINGNLEFYIDNTGVIKYNGTGSSVSFYNTSVTGGENIDYENNDIIIVPFKSNCLTYRKYYVFWTDRTPNTQYSIFLFGKIITKDGSNNFTSVNLNNGQPLASLINSDDPTNTFLSRQTSAMAVSNEINGERSLYWIAGFAVNNSSSSIGGKIMKIIITNPTNIYPEGLKPAVKLNIPSGNNFRSFAARELDLSDDGTKLAWGSTLSSTNTTYYSIIDISSGDYTGTNWNFNISGGNIVQGKGVEFDKTGNNLFFSTGQSSGSNSGIFKRDIVNNTTTFITGSNLYFCSQLERSYNDNNIYAANANNIRAIDATTNQMSSSNFLTLNTNYGTGDYNINSSYFYLLPDQIDGCNYDTYISNPNTFNAINFNTTSGGNWTASGNPISSLGTPITIQNQLNFTAPGVYNISNMEFQFGKDAIMNIESGVTVNLINTKLRAVECGVMWQGVTVKGGGTLNMNSNATPTIAIKSFINDAYVGITSTTNNVNIKVENTQFDANEKHIKIVDGPGSPNITVQNNQFYHLIPLRDQTRGVLYYTWNKNFGKTSVEITNTTSTLISPTTKINNNIFDRGFYGVTITKSSVLVKENTFRNTNKLCYDITTFPNGTSVSSYKDKAVSVNANMMGSKNNLTVSKNTFFDVNRALVMAYQGNLTFDNQNSVDFTNHNALEVYGNKDCDITIENNSFNRCKNNAIMLANNTGTQNKNPIDNKTKIRVLSNTIQSQNNATGITIMEDAPTVEPNYGEFFISGNMQNNIAYGVKTFNVVGYQINSSRNQSGPNGLSNEISNNTINYFATVTANRQISDYNSGIQMLRSRGLAALGNTINSNLNTVWRNRGINCENTNYTLIKKNVIKAGRGVSAILDASGNNYLCR